MNSDEVIAAWNKQADEFNFWQNLGEDEKIEFAMKCAALRCKEIAQQRYLSENQAVDIDLKISEIFNI